ncbi:hypothetical protein [Novosphingobium cyanobacteriorum]|uniref:Glycerophosphoryl diester phosphodiesterase membrane domain-containing protein n=1 Tax=Novosphingobium cyanobacteriorum TaxID=3024215 RepID=A0ABT6CGB3_9SPHN|nr:hypothetical protein [Novosphingobium cyanobacteriorum]MDF8332969.1 hypothetical protein [Novosphingobium cyanobacteriorum]
MTPKLDASAAWKSATTMVSANREVLVAIAGVFFVLPALLGAVLLPKPAFTPGMDDQQMAEAILRFYGDSGPVLLLLSLPLIVGFMAMLKVMLDPARPTVGATLMDCLRLLPSYLGAHILSTLALSFGWLIIASVLILLLPPLLAVPISVLAMTWPMSRVMLVAPEIAVRRVRNPITAIRSSIRDTRGAYLSVLLYFGPAFTLFFIAYGLVMIFVGVVLVQTTEGETQRLLSEGVVGLLFALGYTYFAAMIASVWRQLAAPVEGEFSAFD